MPRHKHRFTKPVNVTYGLLVNTQFYYASQSFDTKIWKFFQFAAYDPCSGKAVQDSGMSGWHKGLSYMRCSNRREKINSQGLEIGKACNKRILVKKLGRNCGELMGFTGKHSEICYEDKFQSKCIHGKSYFSNL